MRVIFGGNSDIGQAINGEHLSRLEADVKNFTNIHTILYRKEPDEIVVCAGVIHPASIKDSDIADWKDEIDVNLVGAYRIANAVIKIGLKPKMVFIGSTSGLRGRAGWSGYCASKAGLISLVQSLAEEGYNAWVVNPSRTETKMRKALFPNEDKSTLMRPSDVARVVEDCFKGKYKSGSSITVRKNKIEVME